MTATLRPPAKDSDDRRVLRFSSMEILGFSDSASTWSESPTPTTPRTTKRGRHEATVADLAPVDIGGPLTRGNVRWWLVTVILLLVAGLAGLGYLVYRRPMVQELASIETVLAQASDLASAIPVLEQFNKNMPDADPSRGTSELFAVESSARSLFEASGQLESSHADMKTAASQASTSVLDGIRLATEAHSYRAALLPVLQTPDLETDPDLIELDEAARMFGDWQLGFNNVRGALPDAVLADVTQQLDILSGDLASIMGRYVDALREDDRVQAEKVRADLGLRLEEIESQLDTTLADVQTRVDIRIEEALAALDQVLEG